MMADDGYEKLCRIKSLLAECMVPPRESKFLNLDRYLEEENGVTCIPDPPQWCNISFRGFQERVLTFQPQYWGADPNATLWFSKYGWRCVEKFIIKCDICSSTVECSSLIQKPDLWGDVARKAHDNLCYWSFCPCPDRFIQIITHPKILSKNINLNWKNIMTYGVELPKIQIDVLDKMGFTFDVLDHLFKIIESNSSEEGVSALVLVICGWLKGSEDKILECAYCQRHLALRHFISVQDGLEVNKEPCIQENRSTETDDSKMETSVTQQIKQSRRCHPAFHRSTGLHKAPQLLHNVTKLKFPSYSDLLHRRYGIFVMKRSFSRKVKSNEIKHAGKEKLGNKTKIEKMDAQEIESNKLVISEIKTLDKNISDLKDVPGDSGNTVSNDQNKMEQSSQDKECMNENKIILQEGVAAKVQTDGSLNMVEQNVVTKIKDGTTGNGSSETNRTCTDTEMTDLSARTPTVAENRANDGRLVTLDETNNVKDREMEGGTVIDSKGLEESVVCLSESKSSAEVDCSVEEVKYEKDGKALRSVEKHVASSTSIIEEMEVDSTMTSSSNEKHSKPTSKRELTTDDKMLEEPPIKKLKDSVESTQLKKKNLNPVNEHRFWCIWRIKTVDRLLGSTKEGWKQILDLLKFGVPTQPSELDEQESIDIFEEVKRIHYMMTNW